MEAKKSGSGQKMIEIDYEKDAQGDQKINITIHSFVLVGSVSYLLEIANFFVQDSANKYDVRNFDKEV